MNNSMTERRIHDPQCEDAFAGREEVEFSTENCRETEYEKDTSDRDKLNIRESDQKIKNKTQGDRVEETMSTKSCRERDTKKARATEDKLNIRESDQKIKNKHKGTMWKKQCPRRVVEREIRKRHERQGTMNKQNDKKIKNKTLENYMNL